MDILINRNNFQTLMDVIIVNLICINMVQWTLTMTTFTTMMVAQEKTWSCIERTLGNDFIPLAIETYGCLHFCFDSFFTTCAHTSIAHHQRFSLIPSMLVSYYWQCMSIALQHVQAIAIIQWVVPLGQGSSLLPHIKSSAPMAVANLWQMCDKLQLFHLRSSLLLLIFIL
jgi:hypothetical protein